MVTVTDAEIACPDPISRGFASYVQGSESGGFVQGFVIVKRQRLLYKEPRDWCGYAIATIILRSSSQPRDVRKNCRCQIVYMNYAVSHWFKTKVPGAITNIEKDHADSNRTRSIIVPSRVRTCPQLPPQDARLFGRLLGQEAQIGLVYRSTTEAIQ